MKKTYTDKQGQLWHAKNLSGSHLTEILALIYSALCANEPKKPAPPAENTSQPD
jgi:hypothetical protein